MSAKVRVIITISTKSLRRLFVTPRRILPSDFRAIMISGEYMGI